MNSRAAPRQRSTAAGYWIGVAVALALLVGVVALLPIFLPYWVLLLCGLLAGVATVYVIAIVVLNRWISSVQRLLGLPGWVTVPLLSTLGVAVVLSRLEMLSVYQWVSMSFIVLGLISLVASVRGPYAFDRLYHHSYRIPLWAALTTTVVGVTGYVLFSIDRLSVLTIVLLTAMAFVVFYAVCIVPLALLNKARSSHPEATAPFPAVSVLVPAYNESGYVGPCIESILDSAYPSDRLEVVVVDDGSTDGTFAEAAGYRDRGVNVFTRENGGKHAALNYGLVCASHDIIVTVDADSVLDRDAISKVVGLFQHNPRVGAVAGTVRISNNRAVLTGSQALEYALSINTFRRAFDLFGAVPVVPGCLGTYRREALEECYGWDPDTLTEDFDVTLHVLKQGWEVHASEATVWTEAPTTWQALYNQRLRWYRGNVMTLRKHSDVFVDSQYGFLHQFVLPLRLLTMVVIPSSSFVVLGSVALALAAGYVVELLVMFGFFLLWQAAVSLLVLQMESERLWLVVFSPLFVIGYKHFHDFVTIKSLFDVLLRDEFSWTEVERVRQREVEPSPHGK